MTDFSQFGKQLQRLRKGAGWSQEQLVEALDRLARVGPAAEYRVLDGALISRWECARVQGGRQWKPTRAYVLHLIQLFSEQLTCEAAQTWAAQVGYQIGATELEKCFANPGAHCRQNGVNTVQPGQRQNPALPRHNLPTALTSFVGRTHELTTLIEALTTTKTRLVTIVGEGGVGKTRLALAAAEAILDSAGVAVHAPNAKDHPPTFPDGLWFVPLVGLDAAHASGLANQLASAIAKAIGFVFHRVTMEPASQLVDFLRSKALLLILDNFEHLSAATPFVLDLLQQTPQVRILITSRTPLNCQAERLVTLQGFPIPFDATQHATDLPGIQLFVERARQQVASFALDAQNVHDVARLCRLVNGNPLGMELAAHWMQHFTVAEMVSALQQQDRSLLATDQRDVPDRHRSMEAVFETSWRLLSPSAQQILAQLTVFRGAFSRQAAHAVAGAAISQLVELVSASLLHTTQDHAGRTNYLMNELLRQYAMTKLAALESVEPGIIQAVHQRHSDFYLGFVVDRRQALYSSKMNVAVAEVQAAIDNIRVAWQWALIHRRIDVLVHASAGLRAFYHARSLYQEGEEVFRGAAAALAANATSDAGVDTLSASLRIAQAFFLNLLHRYDDAIAVVRTVLAQRPSHELSPIVAEAQLEWGVALSLQSEPDEALARLSVVLELTQRLNLPVVEARALHGMFRVLIPKGKVEEATAVLERARHLYQQVGYRLGEGFVLRSLGYVARRRNQYVQALAYWEQAVRIYQEMEDHLRVISIWQHLGDVFEALGDLGRAYRYYRDAYNHRDEVQDLRHAAHTVDGFARLMARLGEYEQACAYGQQALAEQRRLRDQAGVVETLCTLGAVFWQMGDAATALRHYLEALALSRSAGARIYEGLAQLGIGQTYAALGQLDEAVAACRHALTIQRELGQQQSVLETLSELARIALMRNCLDEALTLVTELQTGLAISELHGARDPLRVYWVCYQVLSAKHDPHASQWLTTAYRELQAQAATIDDARLHESFLTNVVINRAIAAAYLLRST